MTSRVSSSRLYKETLKRHYTSLLILVLAFVIHLITVVISLQNYIDYMDEYNSKIYLERILSTFSPNIANGVFAMCAGLFLAFDFFRYLHSKMQTDFYESLPVRKSDLYFTNIICAISSFALLSIITFGLELLVINVFGYGSMDILHNIVWNLICTNLCFIASFFTALLAWIMTGHPIVALLGYGVFVGYVPIMLYNLFPTFADAYFDTFVRMPLFTEVNWNHAFYFLSPGSLMYLICNSSRNLWSFKEHLSPMIAIIAFSIIIAIVAYKLYKKRPGETAGRAMAFVKANAFIRVLIVIPVSLYAGLLLQELSASGSSIGWLVFGIIFVGFIIHGVIEAIFEADVRAAFRKKKQLLLSYIICFAFLSIFWFDLFHYNEFIPKENKVKSVSIYSDNFRGVNYNITNPDGLTGDYVKPALDVANDIIHLDRKFTEPISIMFEYELTNGVVIFREYFIDVYNIPSALDQISKEDAFKDDHCILYHITPDELVNVFVQSNYGDTPIDISYGEKLFHTYLEEYKEFSLSDCYKTPIECQLVFEINDDDTIPGGDYDYIEGYKSSYTRDYWLPVYSSFDKTISLMKDAGYIPFQENEDIHIIQLEIFATKDNESIQITDPAVLEKLKPYMRINDYNYYFNHSNWYNGAVEIDYLYDNQYIEVLINTDDFHSIIK